MPTLLIDDQGTRWDGGSRELRRSFDSPYSGGEFVDYAIANLGFLVIHVYGSSYQVRLRPSMVTDAACAALGKWLRERGQGRVVLSMLTQTWTDELFRTPELAMQRLDQAVALGRQPLPSDYLSQTTTDCQHTGRAAIGSILTDWPRLSQPNRQHELLRLLQSAFGNRYVVVKKDTGAGRLVFQELGEGLFTHYETWRTCAIGAPVEELPDRSYGRWIAATYRDAIEARQPTLENVDAIVRWPHAGRARLRYQRLLVPIQGTSETPLLLSASLMDNRIDLRVGAHG